jgi:phage FluMu protein Com
MANIRCPSCRQLIALTDPPRGQMVKCPACQIVFPATEVGEIAAGLPKSGFADGSIREGSPRGRNLGEPDIGAGMSAWRSTVIGLNLVWWGDIVLLPITLALAAMMIVRPFDPNQPPALDAYIVGLSAGGCLSFVCTILIFVGMCMCCMAPDASARRRAIGSCVCVVLSVVVAMGLVVFVMVHSLRGQNLGQPINPQAIQAAAGWPATAVIVVQVMLMVAALALWIRFHAAIARVFKNPSLASLAFITLVVWLLTMPVSSVFAQMPAAVIGMDERSKMRVQSAVSFVVTLIAHPLYLVLCARTIALLRRCMDEGTIDADDPDHGPTP